MRLTITDLFVDFWSGWFYIFSNCFLILFIFAFFLGLFGGLFFFLL